MECLKIQSHVYEMNVDCFSNSDYLKWYEYSKKKIQNNILTQNEEIFNLIESENSSSLKKFMEAKYYKVEEASNKDLNSYLSTFKRFIFNLVF